MNTALRDRFLERWAKYFPGVALPITFFYTNDPAPVEVVPPPARRGCFLDWLMPVRNGAPAAFEERSLACPGARRYLGFNPALMPNFEYFLSCGIPGEMEGERYKKSPEVVRRLIESAPVHKAPARYIVFKRWDALTEADQPDAVIFFAPPDALAGLFTLAGFEESTGDTVFAPFGAGCSTIVMYPWLESRQERQRAVLGMFDVSARPSVGTHELSFAVPMAKFARMVNDMDESFLTTRSWDKVRARLAAGEA